MNGKEHKLCFKFDLRFGDKSIVGPGLVNQSVGKFLDLVRLLYDLLELFFSAFRLLTHLVNCFILSVTVVFGLGQ